VPGDVLSLAEDDVFAVDVLRALRFVH